jgi:hypothetical protein
VAKAVADLAGRLAISTGEVSVVEILPMEWSDSCLGVHYSDRLCAAVITSGYWIALQAGGKEYQYHTDLVQHVIGVNFVQNARVDGPQSQPPSQLASPPEAYLVSGQTKQLGGTGSYCWSGAGVGAWVEKIGSDIPKNAMSVRMGQPFTFQISFEPARAAVQVWPLGSGQIMGEDGSFSFWQSRGEPLMPEEALDTAQQLEFTLSLNPGRYVVTLDMAGQQGDVVYGFFIEVSGN